jgi:hypothetical protein
LEVLTPRIKTIGRVSRKSPFTRGSPNPKRDIVSRPKESRGASQGIGVYSVEENEWEVEQGGKQPRGSGWRLV